MQPRLKRVAAIHDLSGVGKCSLTVALPILSAAGVECAVLPTAVLSTHTGGFSGYVFHDLTDEILPIAQHWQREQVRFDALYSGYLGSFSQITMVRDIIEMFREPDTLVMVDPVMADNGQLYSQFTLETARGMAALCAKADIVVPNLTEAYFLLGRDYSGDSLTPDEVEELLHALAAMGPRQVVLTGVSFDEHELGAACYDAATGTVDYVMGERIPGSFHGTGDIFASALLAGLLRGRTLPQAARLAVDFTCDAIRRTAGAASDPRFGVAFEPGLGRLAAELEK